VSTALQFSSRKAREKAFIAVWPGDDVVTLEFGGETICAPPIDVVAEAGQGRWRFGSARDERGRAIPGTVLIADRYRDSAEGPQKSFDAEKFLFGNGDPGRGLIGVNELLVARGLMIVDDVSQVAEAQRVGREMWEEIQAKADDDLILRELAFRRDYEAKNPGAPVPPSTNDGAVREAVERRKKRTLLKRPSVSTDDLLAAIGGTAAVASGSTTPAPVAVSEPTLSLGDIASQLWKAAKTNSVILTKPQQQALLDQDAAGMEDVRAALQAKGVSL
jgi:hypothetical protein